MLLAYVLLENSFKRLAMLKILKRSHPSEEVQNIKLAQFFCKGVDRH